MNVDIVKAVYGLVGVFCLGGLTGFWLGYPKGYSIGKSDALAARPPLVPPANDHDEKEQDVDEQIVSSLCPKCGFDVPASTAMTWNNATGRLDWVCSQCTATWTTPPLNLDSNETGDTTWYTRNAGNDLEEKEEEMGPDAARLPETKRSQ